MKLLLINRCARRIRSGAGLVGSLRSIHSQTRSSARLASSRELIVPGGRLAAVAAALAATLASSVPEPLQHLLERRQVGSLTRLEMTLERGRQRLRSVVAALQRPGELARAAKRAGDRLDDAVLGRDTLAGQRLGRAERKLDVAHREAAALAGEARRAQVGEAGRRIGERHQGRDASGGIVVVARIEQRVDIFPIALGQALHEAQSVHRAAQAAQARPAAGEPDRDAEVARAPGQLGRVLVDDEPVGRLGRIHLVAVLALGLAGAGRDHRLEARVVLEVRTARSVRAERRQKGFQFGFSHAARPLGLQRTLRAGGSAGSGRKSCRTARRRIGSALGASQNGPLSETGSPDARAT